MRTNSVLCTIFCIILIVLFTEAKTCGNGILEGNENCDDGNTTPGTNYYLKALFELNNYSRRRMFCDLFEGNWMVRTNI